MCCHEQGHLASPSFRQTSIVFRSVNVVDILTARFYFGVRFLVILLSLFLRLSLLLSLSHTLYFSIPSLSFSLYPPLFPLSFCPPFSLHPSLSHLSFCLSFSLFPLTLSVYLSLSIPLSPSLSLTNLIF